MTNKVDNKSLAAIALSVECRHMTRITVLKLLHTYNCRDYNNCMCSSGWPVWELKILHVVLENCKTLRGKPEGANSGSQNL